MISQRELERKFNKLLKEVETNDFYTEIDLTNRVNCYVCENGHLTKTKDIYAGVTPMFIICDHCAKMSRSHFYKDIAPSVTPIKEWYRPTLKQLLKKRGDFDSLDHILNGGLILRNIATNPTINT